MRDDILNMRVIPSMRLMAMAGPAARRDHSVIYNCCTLPIDSLVAFKEIMLNSMAGCGVGFSVEFANVDKLHVVRPQRQIPFDKSYEYLVVDSAEGWCNALEVGLRNWFTGGDVDFNFSLIRPEGTI